jgi:hypothetical protein
MRDEFVNIPNHQVRIGGTVVVPRDRFDGTLQLGDRMLFERIGAGRTEILTGMVVDLDHETVEIDLPDQEPRFR